MFEAYKVGITVALTNKVSQGLMLIGRDLARTDAQAIKLHRTLKEIKLLGIGGAIVGGAGYAGLHAIGKTLDAAKEYQQAFAQFKSLNLGDSINSQADKFARGASVIGASATDLMRVSRDLTAVLGDKDQGLVRQLAPGFAQLKYANQAIYGGHGIDFNESQLRDLERIIEMKGGFHNADDFLKQGSMMQQVIAGTGGLVKPSDYLNFIKTAGVAGRLLNDKSFYYGMEPLIQEMGGSRVGTGLMSAHNNLAQGRMTVRSATEAMRLGIIDPKMVEFTRIGTIKQVKPGALLGMEQFGSNPYQWMKDVLLPKMAAKGIESDDAIVKEFGTIFSNRTASSLFSLMFLQMSKIDKNMALTEGAMTSDQMVKLARSSPQGAEMALGKAWENLKIAMGESLWPIIIPGINRLAELLRDLGKWVNQHPVKFDYLIKGIAGLSAALAFSGSVLLLKAAFLGFGLIFPSLAGMITGSVLPALGMLSAALIPIAAIAYHKEIAGAIDNAAPGIGDSLLAGKDWLNSTFRLDGSTREQSVAPRASGKNVTVNTAVNLDGRQIATAVTQHQAKAGSAPLTSPSVFDGRMYPAWSGF